MAKNKSQDIGQAERITYFKWLHHQVAYRSGIYDI